MFAFISLMFAAVKVEIALPIINSIQPNKSYSLFNLLSREYFKLIIISNFIAWPLGYFIMEEFLQNYPFRTTLGFEIFVLSALFTWGIAFITVSYQTFRAATTNPIDTTNYE